MISSSKPAIFLIFLAKGKISSVERSLCKKLVVYRGGVLKTELKKFYRKGFSKRSLNFKF